MRTTIIFISYIFLTSATVSAQLYIAPRIAHYFPVSKEWVGAQSTQPNNTGHYDYYGYYAALGSGTSYGGAIGYQSSKWWNVEVNMAVQEGKCPSQVMVDTSSGGYNYRSINKIQARMSQVKFGVAVGFQFVSSQWSFETKTSFFVGLGTQMQLDQSIENYNNGNISTTNEWTYLQLDGMAPGVSQQFLVGWNFTSYFRTTIGVELVGQHWKPKRGLTSSIEFNGIDQTGNFTYSQLNQEYVESYQDQGSNAGPDEPTQVFQPTYSLNTIGVNLSLVFTLPILTKK